MSDFDCNDCNEHLAVKEHLDRNDARIGDLEDVTRSQQSLADRQQVTIENQQRMLEEMQKQRSGASQMLISAIVAAVVSWLPYVVTFAFPAMVK